MDLKRKSDALEAVEPNTKRRFESTGFSKNHLAMDIALKQSPVIQTLFSFMSIQEVNLLKQVCRTWYEEAIELFQLGPVIDNCSLIKMNIEPVLESLSNEEKSEVLKKLTAVYQKNCLKALQDSVSESKAEGSKTNSSSYPSITEPHLVWHFLWRGNKVHPLSKPNFSAILGDYLQSSMKCIPSFSFLNLDHEVDWNHGSVDPKYPTILLKQSTSFITNRSERKIYETLNCLLESALPSACLPDEMYGYNFFEAFHINRYASEHKIILTDWSNRGKNEPNFEDPQFPVKLLIYFVNERGQERVIEKYMKYVQFDVSGGFLNQSLEPPTLLYHDPKFEGFRSTNAISFAVAGENIKSATWEVMYKEDSTPSLKDARLQAFKFLEDCRLQALKFKASLDFPIDDNRTFGFVFYKNCSYRKRRGGYRHFFDTVSKVFPDLKLFKLRLFGGERGQTILRVHLIRI